MWLVKSCYVGVGGLRGYHINRFFESESSARRLINRLLRVNNSNWYYELYKLEVSSLECVYFKS